MTAQDKGQEWLQENPWIHNYVAKVADGLMNRMRTKIDLSLNLPLTRLLQTRIREIASEVVEDAVNDGTIPPTLLYEGITFDHGEILIQLSLNNGAQFHEGG